MSEFATERHELVTVLETLRSDAAELIVLASRVCYSDPQYDEDYKIRNWFRIRTAEIQRIAREVAELSAQLETELSRRAG